MDTEIRNPTLEDMETTRRVHNLTYKISDSYNITDQQFDSKFSNKFYNPLVS